MNADDIARLQAAELHEHMPQTIEETCPIREVRKTDHILLYIGLQCAYVFGEEIRTHFGCLSTDKEIDRAIRILQRAREIIKGGA